MRNIKYNDEPTIVTWRRCTQCNAAQMEFQLREDGICQKCYTGNIEKENEELSNSVTELTNSKTELESKVTELEKQIKKMKCCGNCKHEQDSNTNYYCEECKRFANETDIDKWELAE